jgi:hypothetical protein
VFNLTLSLCDVPLLWQGEGRFGNAKTRVRYLLCVLCEKALRPLW